MAQSNREFTDSALSPTELLQCGFRYALSLAQNTHEAEDLVQEAWLRLARRYAESPSRPLLFVAIRNAFIDQTRRSGVRALTPLDEMNHDVAAPSTDSSAAADLSALLQALRPSEREALYLHHVEGYTTEEIGKLTRVPRNTVLSLLSRAMKKLQVLQKH